MTKTFVQLYVENLLKVLKVLKTRTRARNGLAELRMRYARQGAKAPLKTKEQGKWLQNYYNHQKLFKKLLTSSIIESEEERMVHTMKLNTAETEQLLYAKYRYDQIRKELDKRD